MTRLNNTEGLRDAIRQKISLEDVVRSYNVQLLPSGTNFKAVCPLHADKDPSFGINVAKQLFYCFGCGEGGDMFNFAQKMELIPHNEAIRKIADLAGVDLTPFVGEPTEEDKYRQKLYKINSQLEDILFNSDDTALSKWLQKRQISPKAQSHYRVGYSSSKPDLPITEAEAKALQFDMEAQWTNAIVVPQYDGYGRCAGFRTRPLSGGVKVIGMRGACPLPQPEIYGLYEARRAIRQAGEVILVEGEVDVWQMFDAGFENVGATLGTKLNAAMYDYLESLGISRVTLLADNDKAGREFAMRVAKEKKPSKITVKIAFLECEEKDPDEALKAHGAQVITDALQKARYTFEFLINETLRASDTGSITGKLDVMHELMPYMKNASDFERELACRVLADRINTDYSVILDFFREGTSDSELHNVNAERTVLAKAIHDPTFTGDTVNGLRADDFYLEQHRAIYQTLRELFIEKADISPETVRTLLLNRNKAAGGALSSVLSVARLDGADFLLADLRDKAIRRRVRREALTVAAKLGDTTTDAHQVIHALSSSLAQAVSGSGNKPKSADEVVSSRMVLMHERIKDPSAIVGLDMGSEWHMLNQTLHGLQRSRYVILAAPSGVGKTMIAGEWMSRFAVELDEPCLYFTFETGEDTMIDRMVSNLSGVEQDKIVTGYLTAAEIELVHDAAARVAAAPIKLTGRGIVAQEAYSLIRHDVIERGTRVVFVDYLQLMQLEAAKHMPRHTELGEISRGFLTMAHDLNISIVALAQINRSGIKAGTANKEDIGESYKIIQDCDAAYIVRERTAEEKQDGTQGDAYGLLDKHRHGRAGVGCALERDLAVMRVRESNPRRIAA